MNQKQLFDRLKIELNRFPNFLKSLVQHPMQYVDNRTGFDWTQILLYSFLVIALTQLVYNALTLNFGALLGSLIFVPIQTLVVVGFMSFAIWFILDRLGHTNASVLEIFRAMAFVEIIVSLFVVLLVVVASYLKLFELFYAISVGLILIKAYLFYRALTRQLSVAQKPSLAVVGIIGILFLLPHISNFIDQFGDRYRVRAHQKQEDKMMEDSIKAIEEEFNTED